MTELIVARCEPEGVHGALLGEGRLLDYLPATEGGAGRIHLGRVVRVEPALDAAFVDIGTPEPAWLGRREARFVAGAARDRGIAQVVHEGQAIIVQVRRPALAGKGPRVTTDVILETMAGQARPLRAEPDDPDLMMLWRTIRERAAQAKPPALLHEPAALQRLVRHGLRAGVGRMIADDHLTSVWLRTMLAGAGRAVELAHEPGAWTTSGVQAGLAEALEPEVPLGGGGSLVIEATRALTAIDVNGGSRPPLEANLDAVAEIARALRLRRIGGIVVIDFVDLKRAADRERVVQALRSALSAEAVPVDVLPMSRLGLVQLTRQRVGPTLEEMLTRRCAACAGRGRLAVEEKKADG